jgi:hypothetical protein
LRLARVESTSASPGMPRRSFDDSLGILRELLQIGSEQIELEVGVASATAADVGDELHRGTHIGKLRHDLAHHPHGLELRPPARSAKPVSRQTRPTQAGGSKSSRAVTSPAPLPRRPLVFPDGHERVGHHRLPVNAQALHPLPDLIANLHRPLQILCLQRFAARSRTRSNHPAG